MPVFLEAPKCNNAADVATMRIFTRHLHSFRSRADDRVCSTSHSPPRLSSRSGFAAKHAPAVAIAADVEDDEERLSGQELFDCEIQSFRCTV